MKGKPLWDTSTAKSHLSPACSCAWTPGATSSGTTTTSGQVLSKPGYFEWEKIIRCGLRLEPTGPSQRMLYMCIAYKRAVAGEESR
jgi:hypothetical protein